MDKLIQRVFLGTIREDQRTRQTCPVFFSLEQYCLLKRTSRIVLFTDFCKELMQGSPASEWLRLNK
jgi:hypothetical protein